jgi:hypothetical protein
VSGSWQRELMMADLLHRRFDFRTCSDRVQRQIESWKWQMPYLVEAYLKWAAYGELTTEESQQDQPWEMTVISFEGVHVTRK